jgi:aspartyl protease family protein
MSEHLRPLTPIILSFLVLMGLMTWGFSHLVERRANPNLDLTTGAGASSTVRLQRNRGGSYIAPGQINGQPVTFIVDTGADHVAIPAHLAETLSLERGQAINVMTAGGLRTAYTTFIDSISLGGLRLTNIRGSINPAMQGDAILLGMTFLRHVDFRQQGESLIIEPPG